MMGFRILRAGVSVDCDLSQWIAGNPADVLATNFGKPAALFERFPKGDRFVTNVDGR